jgi:hypothetical protein
MGPKRSRGFDSLLVAFPSTGHRLTPGPGSLAVRDRRDKLQSAHESARAMTGRIRGSTPRHGFLRRAVRQRKTVAVYLPRALVQVRFLPPWLMFRKRAACHGSEPWSTGSVARLTSRPGLGALIDPTPVAKRLHVGHPPYYLHDGLPLRQRVELWGALAGSRLRHALQVTAKAPGGRASSRFRHRSV